MGPAGRTYVEHELLVSGVREKQRNEIILDHTQLSQLEGDLAALGVQILPSQKSLEVLEARCGA